MRQRPDYFRIDYRHPFAQGLVFAGLGALPGTTHYHDSSVYGHSGVIVNSSQSQPILNRIGVKFNGSSSYVKINDADHLDGMAACTITLWVYAASGAQADSYAALLLKSVTGGSSTGRSYGVTQNSTNNQLFYQMQSDAMEQVASTDTSWFDGTNRHICMTWDGSTMSVYANAQSDATPQSGSGNIISSTGNLFIGSELGLYNFFDGIIADVMVFTRALAIPEIEQLADPSNVMLSGLIRNPARRWWPVTSGGGGGFSGISWVVGGGIAA